MHEWALSESVIRTLIKISQEEEIKKISKVKIGVGELQQIDMDIFNFALKEMSKEYNLFIDTKFSFVIEPATFHCNVCGNEWEFRKSDLDEAEFEAIHFLPEVAHIYIKCNKCGSKDFNIIKGRGVHIISINGE